MEHLYFCFAYTNLYKNFPFLSNVSPFQIYENCCVEDCVGFLIHKCLKCYHAHNAIKGLQKIENRNR